MRELVRSLSENDVGVFAGTGKGATPEFHVFGWPNGETEPVNMRIGVGITDDDEASFRGMSKYRFGGEVVVDTINNAGYDTDKILVPGRNGEISFRTEAEIFGDLGIAGTTNYVTKYTSATTMGISQIFDNGTNVGVGTITPASLFSVVGGLTTVGSVVTLGTKETTVDAADVLGRINFYAPLESSGGDSNLVAASIVAIAEAEFTAAVNTTSLQFQTGNSETATTKMTILGGGNVGVGTVAPSYPFTVKSASAGDATISAFIADDDGLVFGFCKDASDNAYLNLYQGDGSADVQIHASGITYFNGGNVGVGVGDPDTKMEIFYAGTQLKLSFDATDNATFAVDTNGDLTVGVSGSHVIIASGKDLRLGNARQAGAPTPAGYVLIEDSTGTQYKVGVEAA